MPEGDKREDLKLQVETLRKAFEHEFERFASFINESDSTGWEDTLQPGEESVPVKRVNPGEAEASLRGLDELRTRYTGKKSELAQLKTMIGSRSPAGRAGFARLA